MVFLVNEARCEIGGRAGRRMPRNSNSRDAVAGTFSAVSAVSGVAQHSKPLIPLYEDRCLSTLLPIALFSYFLFSIKLERCLELIFVINLQR